MLGVLSSVLLVHMSHLFNLNIHTSIELFALFEQILIITHITSYEMTKVFSFRTYI